MSGLPPGWEWDYDGSRWLYRYTPTGHVQYHFPKAGDEFPDFVDASVPAPSLAPEERLESQHQLKRHGSTSSSKATKAASKEKNGWKSRMSATAQPFSAVWEDSMAADEEEVFQPESFMFLGPGTYTDVSPVMDEEDEAAKRSVVGSEQKKGTPGGNSKKSISPLASQDTTPMTVNSQVAAGNGDETEGGTIIVGESVFEAHPNENPQHGTTAVEISGSEVPARVADNSTTGFIDYGVQMYELPVETAVPLGQRSYDPVGFVAEMPTEHTATARVETHPDPIELGDNSFLAPVETEPRPGYVELPVSTSPVEPRTAPAPGDGDLMEERQLEQRRNEVRQKQEERQREILQKVEERRRREEAERRRAEEQLRRQQQEAPKEVKPTETGQPQFKITRKPTLREAKEKAASVPTPPPAPTSSQGQGAYQPYTTGQELSKPSQSDQSFASRLRSSSDAQAWDQGLSHVPSVLKPARNGPHRNSIHGQSPPPLGPDGQRPAVTVGQEASSSQGLAPAGLIKYPSVLRPARGRPGQQLDQRSGTSGSPHRSGSANSSDGGRRESQGSGYKPIPHGLHPPSMTPAPAPQLPPKVVEQPTAAIERPNTTVPANPSPLVQRPHTTAPDLPSQQQRKPIRPISVIGSEYTMPQGVQRTVPFGALYPIDPHDKDRQVTARKPSAPSAPSAPYLCDDPLRPQSFAATSNQPFIKQPTRLESAMPLLEHHRRGSAPGQVPPSQGERNASPPRAALVPAGAVPRPASAMSLQQQLAQQRRQSYQANGTAPYPLDAPVLDPKSARPQSVIYPGLSANFATQATPAPQPIQDIRRRSTQDEVSPIRPRSESQSSIFAMQTPSPMESRRGSANTPASQNGNGSYFTPTPGSQSSNSQGRTSAPPEPSPLNTPGSRYTGKEQQQKPPAPSNAPYPDTEESYFPPQNAQAQSGDKSKRLPAEQLASITQQNPQGAPFSEPDYQSRPLGDHQGGDIQRSNSLRSSAPRQSTGQPLDNRLGQQGRQSPLPDPNNSLPGHLLTRIEEHDEPEHDPLRVAPLRLSKTGSASSTPNLQGGHSLPQGGTGQRPQPQNPIAQQVSRPHTSEQQQQQQFPTQLPSQQQQMYNIQGQMPQQVARPHSQQLQGQLPPQQQYGLHSQTPPPQQNNVPPPRQMPSPSQLPRQGAIPPQGSPQSRPAPGSIQGSVAPQGQFLPQNIQLTGQPLRQQPQQSWSPQQNPNVPGPVPPLQTSDGFGGGEMGKPWAKWFKSSSKSASQGPIAQQGQNSVPEIRNQTPPIQGGNFQHQVGFQAGTPPTPRPFEQTQQQQLPQSIQRHSISEHTAPLIMSLGKAQGVPPSAQANKPPPQWRESPAVTTNPTMFSNFNSQPPANSQGLPSQGQPFQTPAQQQGQPPFKQAYSRDPIQLQDAPMAQPQQMVNHQPTPAHLVPANKTGQIIIEARKAFQHSGNATGAQEPREQFSNVLSTSGLPSQQLQQRPGANLPDSFIKQKTDAVQGIIPPPLFSKELSVGSKPLGGPVMDRREEFVAVKQDKWATKPVVDYSGDDWGDDEFA